MKCCISILLNANLLSSLFYVSLKRIPPEFHTTQNVPIINPIIVVNDNTMKICPNVTFGISNFTSFGLSTFIGLTPYVAASGSLNGFFTFAAGFIGAIGEGLALLVAEAFANGEDGVLEEEEEEEANGDFVAFGGDTLSKGLLAAAAAAKLLLSPADDDDDDDDGTSFPALSVVWLNGKFCFAPAARSDTPNLLGKGCILFLEKGESATDF